MNRCPVCGKDIQINTSKCYSCHSEFTYGKKGRIKFIKRGEEIIRERERKLNEARYNSLPQKKCSVCGNVIRAGDYYCQLCGEDDAYNGGRQYNE